MLDVMFYTDPQKRTIKRDLFSDTAEQWAKKLDEAPKDQNKRAQIRKFYDEVLRLNTLAKSTKNDKEGNTTWDDILPYLNMLIAKAVYAQGRKLVTEDFVEFIRGAIRQVETVKDLDVFAGLFEALMGFYRKYRQS